jgi:hypothetical protein
MMTVEVSIRVFSEVVFQEGKKDLGPGLMGRSTEARDRAVSIRSKFVGVRTDFGSSKQARG